MATESGNDSIYPQLTQSDEEPLTPDIKDHLSMALNEDWKRFAYYILDDQDIQRLDTDNRTVYEKCHAMLNLWNANSPYPINKAILKLKLNELKRRDILADLAEAIPSFGKLHFNDDPVPVDRSRPVTQPTTSPKRKELTVSDLKMRHIEKLHYKLDPSFGSGISNWMHLAHELIGNDSTLNGQIRDLELHYYGGGNPALAFLRRLAMTNPQTTVNEFEQNAKLFHRNDIVVYINENLGACKDKEIRYLEEGVKESIASYLNMNIPGVSNWEMFADEYGYKYTDINQIKAAIKQGQSYSPTKKLFQLLREARPNLAIETIKVACRKLGRNDVVLVLDEITNEK